MRQCSRHTGMRQVCGIEQGQDDVDVSCVQ